MTGRTDRPLALIIRAPGTNCDREMVRAFELAGAEARTITIDALAAAPGELARADLLGLPGGFSYGDDIASGRVFAVRLRERLWDALRAAAEAGVPMIGACNGFQVLVQCGLLPGPPGDDARWPATAPRPTLALAENASATFVDAWVGMRLDPASACLWTRGLADRFPPGNPGACLPIAHGEGRLVGADATLDAMERAGQVVVRYGEDVNGSARGIAGVCDRSGRIFGLMPHPERFLDWNRHPAWTSLRASGVLPDGEDTLGLAMFRAAVGSVIGLCEESSAPVAVR